MCILAMGTMRQAVGELGQSVAALALLPRGILLVYEDLLGWRALLGAALVVLACAWLQWLTSLRTPTP